MLGKSSNIFSYFWILIEHHFVMTGKLLDSRLTIQQVIALRFAGDNEFTALAETAVERNLSNDEIKREVREWRGDHHRA